MRETSEIKKIESNISSNLLDLVRGNINFYIKLKRQLKYLCVYNTYIHIMKQQCH